MDLHGGPRAYSVCHIVLPGIGEVLVGKCEAEIHSDAVAE